MDMTTASVAELKQRLSHYLHAVEAGGEVVVTSHRRPVARLTGAGYGGAQVRPPTKAMASLAAFSEGPVIGRSDVVELLVRDRQRR